MYMHVAIGDIIMTTPLALFPALLSLAKHILTSFYEKKSAWERAMTIKDFNNLWHDLVGHHHPP